MIWNSECHQVRQWLPLLAESDLPLSERTAVERHLLQCSECRREASLTETSQAVLHEVRTLRFPEAGASLWPSVERQLNGLTVRRSSPRTGWIPVGALATACAALLLVGVFGPGFDSLPYSGDFIEVNDGSFRPSATAVSNTGSRYRSSGSRFYSDTDSY